jgi:hypothetical protein
VGQERKTAWHLGCESRRIASPRCEGRLELTTSPRRGIVQRPRSLRGARVRL